MTRVGPACLAVFLGLTSQPAAQSSAAPAFEVASIKPSNPAAPGPSGMPVGGRFLASNTTLRQLVAMAYDLSESRIDGGPDWQTSRRFDVEAKAKEPVAGLSAMQPMLKTLLADRFHLRVHTEARDMPIYSLVVARGDGQLGASVKPSSADCSRADADLAGATAKGGPETVNGLPCTIMPAPARTAGSMTMRANAASMADLARMLTPATGRMVQDRTGLSGRYDWELTFDRRLRPQTAPQTGSDPPPSDSPSLTTALQEQLGLKLEPARGPVDVLVIDSAVLPEAD